MTQLVQYSYFYFFSSVYFLVSKFAFRITSATFRLQYITVFLVNFFFFFCFLFFLFVDYQLRMSHWFWYHKKIKIKYAIIKSIMSLIWSKYCTQRVLLIGCCYNKFTVLHSSWKNWTKVENSQVICCCCCCCYYFYIPYEQFSRIYNLFLYAHFQARPAKFC